MTRIRVDVDVLRDNSWVRMFQNVELEVDEACNREMNRAFETQHPEMWARVPMTNDGTARCAVECKRRW